jgi:hypothetical protein
MNDITYSDILQSKKISDAELKKDFLNLVAFKAESNDRKFCGNSILYHFQLANLLETRVKSALLKEVMADSEQKAKLVKDAEKRGRTGTDAVRLLECYRVNKGAVVFFKPATAKFLYKKFNATSVLDPTAGWGGRLLGAAALNINYTGIDTNITMKPAYDGMTESLSTFGYDTTKSNMIWESCLSVDFEKIDYDFVLTSPPYINLEQYPNMTKFESNKVFYKEFLIPLIDKCLTHIKRNGNVCFNISPKMYTELLSHGYRPADEEVDLLQQKRMGKDKEDKVYIWHSNN